MMFERWADRSRLRGKDALLLASWVSVTRTSGESYKMKM